MVKAETIDESQDQITLRVRVKEGASETTHEVTVGRADLVRLGRAGEHATDFVSRCFTFLLAREPKESILSRFDVSVIARYFPEFEREIKRG